MANIDTKGLDASLVRDVYNTFRSMLTECDEVDGHLLRVAIDCAAKELAKACESLEAVARGHKVPGERWAKGLRDSAKMQEVADHAAQVGFLDVDATEIEARRAALQAAMLREKEVRGMSGTAAASDLSARAETLVMVSTVTIACLGLIKCFQGDPPDQRRATIQKHVKALRAFGLKERDLLPAPMYKWAFEQLTAR